MATYSFSTHLRYPRFEEDENPSQALVCDEKNFIPNVFWRNSLSDLLLR